LTTAGLALFTLFVTGAFDGSENIEKKPI